MNSGVSFWEAIQPWLIGMGIIIPSAYALCIAIIRVFAVGQRSGLTAIARASAWTAITFGAIGLVALLAPETVRELTLRWTAMPLHHQGWDTFSAADFIARWKELALCSGIVSIVALTLFKPRVRTIVRKRFGRSNLCYNCGYSTIGLTPESVCPECGQGLTESGH